MSTSVEVKNLSRRYGEHVHALRAVNLAVAPGEFVTLLGPSGSGKSTILKLVAGFERPSDGDILIDGRSVVGLPSHKRDIGMVFQNYALFPHMPVADNITFPLAVRRHPKAEIARRLDEVLEITRLGEYRHRLPHELSGGQQQRVALARAIVFKPKILLMDEPLAALDRHLREQMKGEIKRIQQDLMMTVLFVTHDQDEALLLSDRIGVMHNGQLEQLATPHDLYARPQNRFIAGFVGEANLLPCRVEGGRVWLNDCPIMTARDGVVAGDVWLMLRPEQLTMSRQATGALLRGRLRQHSFLGETSRYMLDIGSALMNIKRQNREPLDLAIGEDLYLSWKPEDAVILRN